MGARQPFVSPHFQLPLRYLLPETPPASGVANSHPPLNHRPCSLSTQTKRIDCQLEWLSISSCTHLLVVAWLYPKAYLWRYSTAAVEQVALHALSLFDRSKTLPPAQKRLRSTRIHCGKGDDSNLPHVTVCIANARAPRFPSHTTKQSSSAVITQIEPNPIACTFSFCLGKRGRQATSSGYELSHESVLQNRPQPERGKIDSTRSALEEEAAGWLESSHRLRSYSSRLCLAGSCRNDRVDHLNALFHARLSTRHISRSTHSVMSARETVCQ